MGIFERTHANTLVRRLQQRWHGWGGVPVDLFIAEPPSTCSPNAACLPLGLFNLCLYLSLEAVGIMARPEIALKTFT